MAYFLRFTQNAELDLERGRSYHDTDFRKGDIKKKKLAEMMGCEKSAIGVVNGYLVQFLDGLCGYELEADNLEDAIEEAQGSYQFEDLGQRVIFEGHESDDSINVPDGDCFIPQRIVIKL